MAVALIYETHSITTDNENGLATGWRPGELSSKGKELAYELGRRRASDHLDAVYTSDLARAVETAALAFGDTAIPVIQDRRLRECNYGDLNGAPVASLAPLRSQHISTPFPSGQSYEDVVEQTREFLAELGRSRDGQKILLISHSANRWALANLLHGVPLADQIDAPFNWQEGWHYVLPAGWTGRSS